MAKALEGNTASVTTSRAQLRQIGFLPLLALFYGYTAGGPFGYEEIFQGSGPGMSLVFLTFVPFLWSIPISFAAAEMNSILPVQGDRKSTRLNSSHGYISYAVFCLKKK